MSSLPAVRLPQSSGRLLPAPLFRGDFRGKRRIPARLCNNSLKQARGERLNWRKVAHDLRHLEEEWHTLFPWLKSGAARWPKVFTAATPSYVTRGARSAKHGAIPM